MTLENSFFSLETSGISHRNSRIYIGVGAGDADVFPVGRFMTACVQKRWMSKKPDNFLLKWFSTNVASKARKNFAETHKNALNFGLLIIYTSLR